MPDHRTPSHHPARTTRATATPPRSHSGSSSIASPSAPVAVLSHAALTWPDGIPALADATLSIHACRTGIVGANGSGKTTLLRLLSEELTPTAGAVEVHGPVAVLPQSITTRDGTLASAMGVEPVLDALARLDSGDYSDSVYTAIGDEWDIEARAEAALHADGLGYVLDTAIPSASPWKRELVTLSGGEVMRIALAGLRLKSPRLTLLDEPTNNLDRDAREALYAQVDAWNHGALVVVSHDRDLLERMDRTVQVHDGAVRTFDGPYSVYRAALEAEQKAALNALQAAKTHAAKEKRDRMIANDRRQKLDARGRKTAGSAGISRMEADALKKKAATTTAASRQLHEAREADAQRAIHEADAAVRRDERIRVDLEATRVPGGREILRLTTAVAPDRPASAPAQLIVRGPERIALHGPNGSVKTTLLNAIMGKALPPRAHLAASVDYTVPETRMLPTHHLQQRRTRGPRNRSPLLPHHHGKRDASSTRSIPLPRAHAQHARGKPQRRRTLPRGPRPRTARRPRATAPPR